MSGEAPRRDTENWANKSLRTPWKILQELQKRRPAMMLGELLDKRERAPKQLSKATRLRGPNSAPVRDSEAARPEGLLVSSAGHRAGSEFLFGSGEDFKRGTRACARIGRYSALPGTNSATLAAGLLIDPSGEEGLSRGYTVIPGSLEKRHPSCRSCATQSSGSWTTRWRAS